MKRGSALLIVLGMIAFMVISAVAFSAFMRYNRLPSSYLRRSSSSRHLAKAALAEAIDILDASIGDNPHPGFGNRAYRYPRDNGDTLQRNYWRNRCFIGTNQLVSADETVSTLTLEGLAYIPPSLVNEARYFSHHADSARWHDLGYDSGRFAFFALDVSDCFDVNRVPGNWARSSADLGKISLAYAFENADHTGYTVSPSAWDDFMDNYVDFDRIMDGLPAASGASKMPLVSLADFNLAAYAKAGSLAQYVSPFCGYVMNSTDFVTSETGPAAEILRSLNVITDGLYPPVRVNASEADIMRPLDQPFTTVDRGETQPPNRQVLQRIRTSGIGKVLSDDLPPIDLVNLYDYLDENDIPTSLALPTTERVPMVCGLQSALKLHLEPKADKSNDKDPSTLKDGDTYVETTTCRLKVQGTGAVTPMWMFPFRRDAPCTGFSAETALRIGLLTGAPGMRTESGSALVVQDEAGFAAAGVVNGAICPKVQTASPSFSKVDREEDALKKQDLTANLNDAAGWFNGQVMMTVVKTFIVHVDENGNRTSEEDKSKRTATVNPDFKPLAANGKDDGGFTVDVAKEGGSVKVRPYMSLTSRVTKNGKTVDLVPASGADDRKYNNINTDPVIVNIGGGTSTQPVIVFAGDKEIDYGEEFFTKGEAIDVLLQPSSSGGSITCPDPRWNFAPENFVLNTGSLSESQFLTDCGVGVEGRDGDIFMFVSNQGYLQSISELAMLPRSALEFGGGNETTGECGFTFDRSDFVTDRTQLKNWPLMWRTYRLWNQDGYASDDLYDFFGVFDGGRGARVNPYTDSIDAFMAALANTPYSWWAASTNYNATGKSAVPDDDAEQFNKKYAFSAMNNEAKFDWKDLKLVAQNLSAAMRQNENGDWIGCETSGGWENLNWGGGANNDVDLAGAQFQGDTCDLYDVDRKFLYGYWRDCFAAKQQLFLVFVRAEPLMMGGGQIGQTPPQLGARAVALVWRSPSPGSVGGIVASGDKTVLKKYAPQSAQADIERIEAGFPHRTRVLFYRQFD